MQSTANLKKSGISLCIKNGKVSEFQNLYLNHFATVELLSLVFIVF